METFQEHYLSMKRTIAARKLNVDMALIDRAVDYAREKHKDQKRKDGSPYIIHPLAVAEIVRGDRPRYGCDPRRAAARLHRGHGLDLR